MKSSKIANNHNRRQALLNEINKLNFKCIIFVADKRLIYENSGLRFKKSFYKFLNNRVHQQLRICCKDITIYADETGSNEYMRSFIHYFNKHKDVSNLFNESNFNFIKSNNNLLIYVTDMRNNLFVRIFILMMMQ